MKSFETDSTAQLTSHQWDMANIFALQNGNTKALDEFYLMHRKEFLKWSERMFGLDSAEAGDIYQDAILILYDNIHRGKLNQLGASLKTYFFSIGRNLILKKIARQKTEKKKWELVHQEDEVNNTENSSEQEEYVFEAVTKAIKGLSERNQSILKLYYYQQLPLKEIAEKLGYESVDVVKNQKVRCMKYLKKLVESHLVADLELA